MEMAQKTEHRPLVLVVDDNDDHRDLYVGILQSAGFEVIAAPDGKSGINQARAIRPDVILMDLYMPGLNGWEACRLLKTSGDTARIPVIALTALKFEEAQREASEAGCVRFITKGTDLNRVVQTVREVLADAAA
jgi:two-component system, cell cycle response regulator DivK